MTAPPASEASATSPTMAAAPVVSYPPTIQAAMPTPTSPANTDHPPTTASHSASRAALPRTNRTTCATKVETMVARTRKKRTRP